MHEYFSFQKVNVKTQNLSIVCFTEIKFYNGPQLASKLAVVSQNQVH